MLLNYCWSRCRVGEERRKRAGSAAGEVETIQASFTSVLAREYPTDIVLAPRDKASHSKGIIDRRSGSSGDCLSKKLGTGQQGLSITNNTRRMTGRIQAEKTIDERETA